MSKAKSATVLHLLRPAHRLCDAVLTRRRPLGALASLVVAALSMGMVAWLLGPSGLAQAQDSEPAPVENLRCTVRTDVVAFFWEKPEWSGGEVSSYRYELTMPDGRTEGGQFYKSYTSAVRWGSYESGQEARFSITANYETADGRTVSSAEAELTCWVGGEPKPANRAPTVASALNDATIVNESGTHQVSLSGVFDDADGDDLTITAASSHGDVATVSVSADYASLTVTARNRGTATITATADDGHGGTVSDTFTVTVKAAPVVASALPDVADLAEDATQEVSLSGVFSDADGDSLTVSAASSNNGVARVLAAVDGSKLTVAAVAEGEATVTVTAEDSDGNRVSDGFDVAVAAAQPQLALSSDATLRSLAVHRASSNQPDAGGNVPYAGPAYQLTPALTAGVYDYRVRVPELRPDEEGPFYVTTVATTAAPGAGSIVVSGKPSTEETRDPKREVATGEASGPWQTFVGHGLITIVVTSLDGNSVQTYRVLVEQGSVEGPQGVAVAPGDGQLTLSWGEPTGSDAPDLYWARWREAGTTNWLNRATLSGWKTSYGDDAADGTAADGQRMPSSGRSYVITGLTNGTEYEVELRGTRGGDTGYGVTNWLKSGWTAVRGTPGQPAVALTITPGSPTREYGGTDDLGYAVGGLAAGDTAGDVVTGSLSRAPGNDAGSYAISMGTLAIAPAYAEKYTLPSAPAVATYTITPRAITAVSGVTVDSRPADGSAAATFDTSAARGAGVLAAELSDFQAGGLAVSGSFPAATPGTHDLSVTYSLQDQGTFKAANYTLSAATDTLQGVLTEVAACGSGLMLFSQGTPAEGGGPVTVTAGLSSPAGPDGVTVTLTTGGTATSGDDYNLSTDTVNIAEGDTAATQTIAIIDDAVDDDDETIILNAAASASSLTASPLVLTIIDNDDAHGTPVANAGCKRSTPMPTGGTVDYDTDDDGLIEVSTPAQFKAINWDREGDGLTCDYSFLPRGVGTSSYASAFPNAVDGMGCPNTGCVGYELVADLDFGNPHPCGRGDVPLGSLGWIQSIGIISWWGPDENPYMYSAIFEGNGHTISRFRVVGPYTGGTGLFTELAAGGVIRNLRLEETNVTGGEWRTPVGGLVGTNHGAISNVHATGCVVGSARVGGLVGLNSSTGIITDSSSGGYAEVLKSRRDHGRDSGGLVGHNAGSIRSSYSTAEAAGLASDNTGGLVGYNSGSIRATYATGHVRSQIIGASLKGRYLGGLVGRNNGDIIASYSTGRVLGGVNVDPLVGVSHRAVVDSYWDTAASGRSLSQLLPGRGGTGKTTAQLQSPTGYTGIFADWNVDLDGDGRGDDPWDFGTSCQYPALKHGGLNPDDQRAPCTVGQSPNRVPTVVIPVGDSTIDHAGETRQIPLSGVFRDADNDALVITAASSDREVATVSVASDYSTLTVTAKGWGLATITVTADDRNGGAVQDSFHVTVKSVPVVAQPLADASALEVGGTLDVTVSGVFSDAEHGDLTITAASSDDAIATVTVASDGSKLTVAGVSAGTATITVSAEDVHSNRVSDAFDVEVVKNYAGLIAQIYEWRNDSRYVHDKAHTDRWDRALLAFGETVVDTTLTPMPASEAQGYADRGWTRWVEVAKALREIEAG